MHTAWQYPEQSRQDPGCKMPLKSIGAYNSCKDTKRVVILRLMLPNHGRESTPTASAARPLPGAAQARHSATRGQYA
jgi:hypothetical protein